MVPSSPNSSPLSEGQSEGRQSGEGRESEPPPNQHILIVEDDEPTQMLMQQILPETYDVDVVSDAEAALEAVRTAPYDLVLMDIGLKGKRDGIDLFYEMKEMEHWGDTKAIAVTAYALPGDRERILEAGFDDYVAKPFMRGDFLRAIAEVLS